MKFVGDLKKSPNWLVATFVTVAICCLSTSMHRRDMPTIPEEFLDTSLSATATTAADSKVTPELKTEGIAQNIARRLHEQSAFLANNRANAALEREHQQQSNNDSSTAHRSLHSGSHQEGRGGGYRGGGGYYRQYNGYGGKKGNVGKGVGGNQYYDGITAKGNGKGRKYYNWKPSKGKGVTAKGNGKGRRYYNWKPSKGKGVKGKDTKGKGYGKGKGTT
jgi:hypothetical protein